MKITVFSAQPYDKKYFLAANKEFSHQLIFHETRLQPSTVELARGSDAICAFVNDDLGEITIEALKSGKIAYLGLDVYEQEGDLFFHDLSDTIIRDDVFERLLTFPNVLITGHQGFFTEEALTNIATTTLENLACYEANKPLINLLHADQALAA